MKIYSISKVLAFPFLLLTGFFLFQMFGSKAVDTVLIFIPVVFLTVIYTFHGQIDYWYLKKFPPLLDDKIKKWLITYSPYYNNLKSDQKKEFERRLVLYVEARAFQSVGSKELKEVPFDIKNIIASQAIKMCLGLDDFLIKDMDRIFLYKHPFPTPRFHHLHTVECDVEDGVLIFSSEQGLPGIVNPSLYYNIVLHGFAQAFVLLHPEINFPDVEQLTLQDLEKINGINLNLIKRTLGFEYIDILPVHIVAFFDFSEEYSQKFPKEHGVFCRIFNQKLNFNELPH